MTIAVIGARTDETTAATAEMTAATGVADPDCSGNCGPARPKGPADHGDNESAQLNGTGEGGEMIGRRLWAGAALLLALLAIVLAVAVAVAHFPKGLSVLVCLVLAVCAAWYGARRRGTARTIGIGAGALLLCGAILLVIVEGRVLEDLLVIAGVVAALAAARIAFRVHVRWPEAERPPHPVLFYNPKSGGGKAERFHGATDASVGGESRRGVARSAVVCQAAPRWLAGRAGRYGRLQRVCAA